MSDPASSSWAARYRVLERLGAGSMGVVYRALQVELNREVALKTLADGAGDAEMLERMRREAVALSAVNHPGLAKVFEISGPGEHPYIAMELVRGETLEAAVQANPVGIRRRAAAIFEGIASAMAAVHRAGLLHRDLKPANVMLAEDERPMVMDLGLATDARWDKLTATGIVVGTPAYFAPELIEGGRATRRSDVWALGAIYFFLNAGHAPFRADTGVALARAICTDPLPDLDVACPDLKEPARRFLTTLLERDPAKRPADAGVVLDAFRKLGRPARAKSPRVTRPRWPWAAALAGAAAGALTLAALRPAPVPAPAPPPALPAFIAGPHPVSPPLFSRWRQYAAYRARLDASGDGAATAVGELRRIAPVDLGSSPESWRHWLDLGAWLDAPKGHRSDDHPANLSLGALQAALVYSATWHATLPSARQLMFVLDAVMYAPRDGTGWLVLGTLLEDEGSVPQAQAAYGEGLHVLGAGKVASTASVRVWYGLARALESVPGHSLKNEWARHLPEGVTHRRPWRGLQLGARDRKVARALMRTTDERAEQAASAVLGSDLELHDRDPEAARQHWEGQLALKRNQEVEGAMHEHFLARGLIGHARDPVPTDPVIDLLLGPARELRTAPDTPRQGTRDYGRAAKLTRLIEARAIAAARDEGERQMAGGAMTPLALTADLFRAGDAAAGRALRPLADRWDATWDDLDRLAGATAPPVVAPWAERSFSRETSRAVGGCVELARALWHSRAGRHAPALDALLPLVAVPHVKEHHGEDVLEVCSRPLWQRLAARTPDDPVIKRLPVEPPVALHHRTGPLWRALRAGDRVAALSAARDAMDVLPRATLSQLSLAWAAAAASDKAALEQARCAARYHGAPLWVLDEIERAGATLTW